LATFWALFSQSHLVTLSSNHANVFAAAVIAAAAAVVVADMFLLGQPFLSTVSTKIILQRRETDAEKKSSQKEKTFHYFFMGEKEAADRGFESPRGSCKL
jgi:hypothetical protein